MTLTVGQPLNSSWTAGTTPPLDPTADEARRLLQEELAKGTYQTRPSLTELFAEWLARLLGRAGGGPALPSWVVPVVVLVVLAVIGLILWRVLRRDPPAVRTPRAGAVLDGRVASADEFRAGAAAALERGDVATAVLDGYRAIVVRSIERVLLDDLPGRTAHEAARDLAPFFPDAAPDLSDAADEFDAVRYGELPTTAPRAHFILDLEERIAHTRPVLAESSDLAPAGLSTAAGSPSRLRSAR